MSNIIKLEKSAGIKAVALSFSELNKGVKSASRPVKEKGRFERDGQIGKSNMEFRPGDGFSFKIDRGEERNKRREEADDYLEIVKKKAVNIEREAFLRGVELGRRSGSEEIKKEISTVITGLRNALSEVNKIKEEIYSRNKDEMVDLVLLIAGKVVHHEIEIARDTIGDVIKWAIGYVTAKDEMIIKINPDDMETAVRLKEDLKKIEKDIKGITLLADPSITRGGCLIETDFGSVDARIESQIDELAKVLRENVND